MPQLITVVISRKRDFEKLFEGFTRLWAVSYVVSPDLLLEFFDQRGYTEVEVIVGENLSDTSYRQNLEQKSIEVTERLAELVEDGKLRVYIPERTIHTKLYILECPESVRIIVTSANFTETARRASRQTNYAWYADVPNDSVLLNQVRKDYEAHRKGCSLFMDDLRDLLSKRQDMDRKQLIEAWLKGHTADEDDFEASHVFQDISSSALQSADVTEEPVIRVQLPESPIARKQIDRFLAPLQPSATANEVQLPRATYIRYVQETFHFPLLRFDRDREELRLGLNGSVVSLTAPLPDTSQVNQCLQHIEDYIHTVNLGQTTDPTFVKTSMYEALLYILSAPFANEQMRIRRRRHGVIDRRGPKFLYIYGPSQNGKSTFLRFILKLLSGDFILPLPSSDFTRTRLRTAGSLGTAFPLMFDDFVPSQRSKPFEEVVKSYWEVWWNEELVSPQIILSSNDSRLRDWAKTRIIRVDFDVQFVPNQESRDKLAEVFERENNLFRWFSYSYIKNLQNPNIASDDELKVSRIVMKGLYDYAGRALPEFFPQQPIETLYDPGRREWRNVLNLGKATTSYQDNRLIITFSQDMQYWEIRDYRAYLPQTVKSQQRGNTLIIETPDQFNSWFEDKTQHQRRTFWNRLLRR